MAAAVICADEGAARTDADRAAKTSPGVWEDLLLKFTSTPSTVTSGTSPPSTADASTPPTVTCPSSSPPADSTRPPRRLSSTKSARQFPNTTVVTVPAGGHVLTAYDDCLRSITLAFTANPTAPLDTTCTAALPAPFAPPDQ